MSHAEAEIWSADPPAPLTDLRLELAAAEAPSEACYGKVTGLETEPDRFCVHFTSVPPTLAAFLSRLQAS